MADIKQIKIGNDTYDIKDAAARGGLSSKVDKVTGKGLSTNDYTDEDKNKIEGLAAVASSGLIADLDDVDIDTPASGDSLTYNGDKWINNHAQITSSEPYTFRQGLGTMAYMEIVGGTVAWNQLVQSTDTSVTVQSGHKYYANINGVKTVGLSNGTAITINDGTKDNIIDLTLLFGSTIADAIYAMEQATEGAGVAWFRKLFPADYYSYDSGSLKSVEGLQSRDISGFNQWDEEWEVGGINAAYGTPVAIANRIRSKSFSNIIGGQTYYKYFGSSETLRVFFYDKDKNYISYIQDVTFIAPTNAYFFKVSTENSTYGETYKNDICINISDPAKNGTYEPYHGHSYSLDSSLTLRGIPKLDSNNKLYYDGDIYKSDGSVERKYVIVDLGTLSWTADGNRAGMFYTNSLNGSVKNYGSGICSIYEVRSNAGLSNIQNMQLSTASSYDTGYIFAKNDSYTDAATFKTAMSGVMLVYELATPTTESAQPYQNPQRAFSDGTEGFTMTGIVPVGNNTTYQLSKALIPAEDYTDGAVRVMQGDVDGKADKDMISDAWVSGQAYAVGDYCIYGNMIYRCVQTVTQGTAILPTNTSYWTPTKIAAELETLNSRLAAQPVLIIDSGVKKVETLDSVNNRLVERIALNKGANYLATLKQTYRALRVTYCVGAAANYLSCLRTAYLDTRLMNEVNQSIMFAEWNPWTSTEKWMRAQYAITFTQNSYYEHVYLINNDTSDPNRYMRLTVHGIV